VSAKRDDVRWFAKIVDIKINLGFVFVADLLFVLNVTRFCLSIFNTFIDLCYLCMCCCVVGTLYEM